MIIPYTELSDAALTGLVEEFVSREGTDYGGVHVELGHKVATVLKQLQRGSVVVVFDPAEQRANLVVADSLASQEEKKAKLHYEPDDDPGYSLDPDPDPDPYGDY